MHTHAAILPPMPREPFSDEEKLEADLLAEDFTGKPINHGSTAKAIAALEKRLAYLRQRHETMQPKAKDTDSELALIKEIRAAETQLAAYRQQQESRN